MARFIWLSLLLVVFSQNGISEGTAKDGGNKIESRVVYYHGTKIVYSLCALFLTAGAGAAAYGIANQISEPVFYSIPVVAIGGGIVLGLKLQDAVKINAAARPIAQDLAALPPVLRADLSHGKQDLARVLELMASSTWFDSLGNSGRDRWKEFLESDREWFDKFKTDVERFRSTLQEVLTLREVSATTDIYRSVALYGLRSFNGDRSGPDYLTSLREWADGAVLALSRF
jgi:hypothetical protein